MVPIANYLTIDDGDPNRCAWAGLDASGRFTDCEAIGAHVALAHDAEPLGVMRHFVRTFEHAILATDALIIEVPNNSGEGIFFVSQDRATVQARRIDTVMTSGRDCLLVRQISLIAHEKSDGAPGFIILEAVKSMTGSDAGFAAGAFIQVHFESVLLATGGFGERD